MPPEATCSCCGEYRFALTFWIDGAYRWLCFTCQRKKGYSP